MRRSDAASTLASVVVLTGVQGVAPALPEMRDAFGLDDAGASVLTFGYLLASAVIAAPVAALADRLGERRVLVASLLVFGVAGGAVMGAPNIWVLIAARTVQGAAFGVVLAVTIGLTGKGLGTVALARAQSTRVIAMAVAEVVLPLAAGGILELANWRVVGALQLAAIPAALICAVLLTGGDDAPSSPDGAQRGLRPALSALHTPFGAAVQVPGFIRFLLKFAVLTYWPLLAADDYAMSPWAIGAVLSATAVASIVAAWMTPILIGHWGTAWPTLAGLLCAAVPLMVFPAVPSAMMLAVLVVITGLGDGLIGVANNVSASLAAPDAGRSAFFGLTGSVRNLGKVAALAVIGGVAVAAPLSVAFAVAGSVGLVSTAVLPTIARGERERASGKQL